MPVFKYRDPETGEWISVGGGGSSTEDIVISKEDPVNVDIWIDPDEEADGSGSSGSGIAIGDEEPTGDEEVWIDTDDEAGEYYTKEEASNTFVQMVKLWENPDSTVEFSAQTISLDLSGYNFVGVYYKVRTSGTFASELVILPPLSVGLQANPVIWNSDTTIDKTKKASRLTQMESNGVRFDIGWETAGDTGGENNGVMIPLQIYGIKGVQ